MEGLGLIMFTIIILMAIVLIIIFYVIYMTVPYKHNRFGIKIHKTLKYDGCKITNKKIKRFELLKLFQPEIDHEYYDYIFGIYYNENSISSSHSNRIKASEKFIDNLCFCERIFDLIEKLKQIINNENFEELKNNHIYYNTIEIKSIYETDITKIIPQLSNISEEDEIITFEFHNEMFHVILSQYLLGNSHIVLITNKDKIEDIKFFARFYYNRNNFEDQFYSYMLEVFDSSDGWVKDLLAVMYYFETTESS